jgi:hypothetical protein
MTAEAGAGQTQPAPDVPKTTFFSQRLAGRWPPSDRLDIAARVEAPSIVRLSAE